MLESHVHWNPKLQLISWNLSAAWVIKFTLYTVLILDYAVNENWGQFHHYDAFPEQLN